MARAKKKKGGEEEELGGWRALQEETRYGVIAIVFFVLATFFVLAAWDLAGAVGAGTFNILNAGLGVGYATLPLVLFFLGIAFWRTLQPRVAMVKAFGGVLFFISALGLLSALFNSYGGGLVGSVIAGPLTVLFDVYASVVFLFALLLISLFLIFDRRFSFTLPSWFPGARNEEEPNIEGDYSEEGEEEYDDEEYEDDEEEEYEDEEEEPDDEDAEGEVKTGGLFGKKGGDGAPGFVGVPHLSLKGAYDPPPLSLLKNDGGKPGVGDIKANANIIKRTLANFGITVEMDEVSVGPAVTRYALKPAEGVKLSRIVGLQNDLGLALAAHPIRIEAPIPGKSLVGIEVPNTARSTVGLATMMASAEFKESDKSLLFALGKSVTGHSFFANLAQMPHILIAGATGSGKSVTIHSIITSLLYRNSPEHLRLIMVDPKRVELTLYNNIPHLLTPVITDAKRAILALKWAAKEMDRRYDILESESVRDISSYHNNILAPAMKKAGKKSDDAKLPEAMPYIVVVIDELADIMSAYPRELESAIVRLAQMSRAVGIHLVLSTQRPSVNVITGLIKANIPARIALQVSSQVDSRTILDMSGAEKLLGAGDMLYLSGEMGQPKRLQSVFVSEGEVKRVVKHLAKQGDDEADELAFSGEAGAPEALTDVMENGVSDDEEDDDELYEEAYDTVVQAKKASTSYLQRKLKVGYARAARLMDMLEERGVVGPADGAKPREVLVGDEGYGESDYDDEEEYGDGGIDEDKKE